MRGHALAILALVLASLVPVRAAADERKRMCAHAYEQAQRARLRGALLDARRHLLTCGGRECPDVMHADCARWLTEVETALPSVVFHVEGEGGAELRGVRIEIDGGTPITLGARALTLDPGEHEVRFLAEGYEPIVRRYLITEGEKLRRETVRLTKARAADRPAPKPESVPAHPASAPAAVEPAPSRSRIGVPFVVASSAAVLGGAAFVYFGLDARAQDRALGACEPNCTRAAVDSTKRSYLYANLGLGVGAAGLVTAALLFVFDSGAADPVGGRGVRLGAVTPEGALGPSAQLRF